MTRSSQTGRRTEPSLEEERLVASAHLHPGARAVEALPAVFSAMVVGHAAAERTSLSAALVGLGASPLHQAGSTGEALICARAWGPCDLAVVDLALPDGAALNLVRDLRADGWRQVLVVAEAGSTGWADQAFAAGARGCLVRAAQGVQGRRQRTNIDAENRLDAPAGTSGSVPIRSSNGIRAELSGREVQVLQLVAHGHPNREVAERLGLSALTVKSHLSRISRRLGTGDRAELVALGMRAGVIT
ncbi:MAG: response regulator transcription factor [Mycobacteriaceae bacterium]